MVEDELERAGRGGADRSQAGGSDRTPDGGSSGMDSSVSGTAARPLGKESWSPSAGSMVATRSRALQRGGNEEAGGVLVSPELVPVLRPGRTGRGPGRVGTGAVTPGITSNGRFSVAGTPAGLVEVLAAGLDAEEGCNRAGADVVAGGCRAGGESGGPESWASTMPVQPRKNDSPPANKPLVIATLAFRTVHASNTLGLGWTYRPEDQALTPFFLSRTRFIAALSRAAVTTGFFSLEHRGQRENCQAAYQVDTLPAWSRIRFLCPPADVPKPRMVRAHAHRTANHCRASA